MGEKGGVLLFAPPPPPPPPPRNKTHPFVLKFGRQSLQVFHGSFVLEWFFLTNGEMECSWSCTKLVGFDVFLQDVVVVPGGGGG